MADSSTQIAEYKQLAVSKLLNAENIVLAINAKDENGESLSAGDLVYKHIFPFGFLPETAVNAGAYIGVEISMPQVSTANYFFKELLLTITITCHQDYMRMMDDEPLKATGATRLDYLSTEVEKVFNKTKGFGVGELELVSNIETALDIFHRTRLLRFKLEEPSGSFC